MYRNLILLTDSYKVTHFEQYPPGTTHVYSYWESRGGQFPETVMFGLNYLLHEYLAHPINMNDIDYAEKRFAAHFGTKELFNRAGWERIVKVHNGRLPVLIKAVPEGTVVPIRNVLMTVENTDPELPWLTNYLETLLCQLWYPTTVATQSRAIKQMIGNYLKDTGDLAGLPFKLHDFGFRGVSSVESAAIGGAAHLVNFMGTDTMAGYELAYQYYQEEMAGFSIPAAEHSTITSWGRENEAKAFTNMIDKFGTGKSGLYAVVSDSYDIFNATKHIWGEQLKNAVLAAPNTLVVRPDSGIPHQIVLAVLENLGAAYGVTINAKGYKVLNKVRVIQGDGVEYAEIDKILGDMKEAGWSADNVAFGMGGALLQKLNRDTQRFAFKCSSVTINGEDRDVWKDPVTDAGKHSKRGRLRLIRDTHTQELKTVRWNDWVPGKDLLETVFENGTIKVIPTFAEIRERAKVEF